MDSNLRGNKQVTKKEKESLMNKKTQCICQWANFYCSICTRIDDNGTLVEKECVKAGMEKHLQMEQD